MSRILVTGATGFIGAHVVEALAGSNHEVHATSPREGPNEEVHWHPADLLDQGTAAELIRQVRPTHLLHAAWGAQRGGAWDSPEHLLWLEASARLWREFAAGGGMRSLILGTCAEYEWGPPVLSEGSTPLRPATLYGASKDGLRRALESASRAVGSSLAWARVFFVYGPDERPDRLVPSVVSRLIAGEPAPVTEGRQVRDYLHVRDVADALVTLIESDLEGPVNVGSGTGVAVRDLIEQVGRAVGRAELIEFGSLPRPPDDPDEIVADVTRLRDEAGWTPSIGLEEGVADVVARARPGVR